MDRYLAIPIKELIDRFPGVGEILESRGIGCVPCSVGTCLFRDIVEIHNLSPMDENALMKQVASVVAPGQAVRLPEPGKPRNPDAGRIAYSPPMKRLVDEHKLIKRFIALVPALAGRIDVESEAGRKLVLDCVEFIRNFADRFHHAKEEDILFAFFDPGLDILKAMHEDHRRGRACVAGIVDALERGDREEAGANFLGYAAVLTEHIKKEDEILYPWMDRGLSTRQVGEMFARFREADDRYPGARERYESFVAGLEETFIERIAEVRQ